MVPEPGVDQAGAMTENPTDSGPRVSTDEVRDLARLRRSSTDKHVAGVAGGLGRHLDIDPVILRVAFVVLTFFGGAGLIAYGGLWLLVPRDDQPTATIDLDARNRSAALIGVAVLGALALLGDMLGGGGPAFWVPLPLVAIGVIAWLVLSSRQRRRDKWAGYVPPAPPGTPYAGSSGWVPPATQVPPAPPGTPVAPVPPLPPRPRDPRKRGPKLFWATLPLIALGMGVLGLFDVGGVPVADAAYPALALGIIAAMLLLGAFWGRAGGLILLGLIATVATLLTTAAERWDGTEETARPTTAAQVDEEYWIDAGELTVDLSGVTDLAALDGQHIEVGVGTGRVEVILPTGLDVEVDAEVGGPGEARVLGERRSGLHVSLDASQEGGANAPDITLDVFAGLGEILVKNP